MNPANILSTPLIVFTISYQTVPEYLHHWRDCLVGLVWCGAALPILTGSVHVTSALVWLVWILLPAVYHCLPNITRSSIWLDPAHKDHLPTPPPPMVIDDM